MNARDKQTMTQFYWPTGYVSHHLDSVLSSQIHLHWQDGAQDNLWETNNGRDFFCTECPVRETTKYSILHLKCQIKWSVHTHAHGSTETQTLSSVRYRLLTDRDHDVKTWGIWKRFRDDLSDVSGLLVCDFVFVLHMSCCIPSSVFLFYLANAVPRGGLRMFDGQGWEKKKKKKRYRLYAVGHQRTESRDTFCSEERALDHVLSTGRSLCNI